MKKILSIALALCLGALPMGAQAAETIITRLDFTNVGDGEGQTSLPAGRATLGKQMQAAAVH